MIGSIISTLGPSPMPVGDGLFSFTSFLRHQGLDEDYLGFNTNIRSSKNPFKSVKFDRIKLPARLLEQCYCKMIDNSEKGKLK